MIENKQRIETMQKTDVHRFKHLKIHHWLFRVSLFWLQDTQFRHSILLELFYTKKILNKKRAMF